MYGKSRKTLSPLPGSSMLQLHTHVYYTSIPRLSSLLDPSVSSSYCVQYNKLHSLLINALLQAGASATIIILLLPSWSSVHKPILDSKVRGISAGIYSVFFLLRSSPASYRGRHCQHRVYVDAYIYMPACIHIASI